MSKDTIKQHYVPRAFLERWCKDKKFFPIKADDNNPEEIEILKETGVYPFCFENYFYANERGKKDKTSQNIEKRLTDIENIMYPIFDNFESKILNGKEITYEDKVLLASLMLIFEIRGKRGAELSDNLVDQLYTALVSENKISKESFLKSLGGDGSIILKDNKIEMGTLQRFGQMENISELAHHLANKDWVMEISRDGDFIVTDTPYLDIPNNDPGIFSNIIYNRLQYFILSPKIIIFIKKDISIQESRYLLENNNIILKSANILLDISKDSDKIDTINAMLFDYCVKFGFHNKRLILERLKEYTVKNSNKN